MLRVILHIVSDTPSLTAEAATLAAGFFRDATQAPDGNGPGILVGGFGSPESLENARGALSDAFGPAVTVLVVHAAVDDAVLTRFDGEGMAIVPPAEAVAYLADESVWSARTSERVAAISGGTAPVAEVAPAEVAPVDEDEDEDAFVLRLTGLEPQALVDEGIAVCRALAGKVEFAEPPTGWEGDAWCIRGRTKNPDPVLEAVNACKASVSVSRA